MCVLPPTEGQLDGFQVWVLMNEATVNIRVACSPHHKMRPCLTLTRETKTKAIGPFAWAAALLHIPTSNG